MAYVLHTSQLRVRRAEPADAEFIRSLWSSPRVMCFVGFPKGLATTANEIEKQIEGNSASELGVLLIAETLKSNVRVGQCKIGAPDEEGICEPDIKLKPEHWGDGCGKELWAAMIDYAFTHSPAEIVQGTPNRANTASVHMQQGAGMVKVDEGVFEPNLTLHPEAVPVPYFKLQITREQWLARQEMDIQQIRRDKHER